MKNLKGCIPDREKSRFHTLGLHQPIAVLNKLVKTSYCVVDGICGDLDFEEGGNPVQADRIIVGRNPLTVDSLCAELIGYLPGDIGYLTEGRRLGLGEFVSQHEKIIELNAERKPAHKIMGSRLAERYKSMIHEDAACSVCYSSLVHALHRMKGYNGSLGKIHIGQGFVGKSGNGIGVGDCASGFSSCVQGCPPKAVDIREALT
jgi:ferredoxin